MSVFYLVGCSVSFSSEWSSCCPQWCHTVPESSSLPRSTARGKQYRFQKECASSSTCTWIRHIEFSVSERSRTPNVHIDSTGSSDLIIPYTLHGKLVTVIPHHTAHEVNAVWLLLLKHLGRKNKRMFIRTRVRFNYAVAGGGTSVAGERHKLQWAHATLFWRWVALSARFMCLYVLYLTRAPVGALPVLTHVLQLPTVPPVLLFCVAEQCNVYYKLLACSGGMTSY